MSERKTYERTRTYWHTNSVLFEKVERYIPGTRHRRDFLGLFDYIAIWPDSTEGVQVKSTSDPQRRDEILNAFVRSIQYDHNRLQNLLRWNSGGRRASLYLWVRDRPGNNGEYWWSLYIYPITVTLQGVVELDTPLHAV